MWRQNKTVVSDKLQMLTYSFIWPNLTVSSELPVIEPHPPSLDVILNNPITLPCRATGSPTPTITWQKEGISITTTGHKYYLCIYASRNICTYSYNIIITSLSSCQVEVSPCFLMAVCRSQRPPCLILEHTCVWLKILQALHWARQNSEYKVGHTHLW